ncbi:MAG: fibronectin/fibrinogen-binding protein [Ruminococcaceae bacterium]|nr:fibronectin/fibrinogen-binding protein [Oscillospiraceae bacterium]
MEDALMAFDAGILRCVMHEIDTLKESRIEKIHQPSNDEIIIALHSATKKTKILINAGSNYPRINLTETTSENPPKAPNLCMLLRKHLNGAKLTSAYTMEYERVAVIEFEAYDEMGFKAPKYLISEIMGKYSNIILADQNKKIIALLKPIDFSISLQRQLLVGMKYELPPKQDKLNPLTVTEKEFFNIYDNASAQMKAEKFITSYFQGIASSTAREIVFSLTNDIDSLLLDVEKQTLYRVFLKIISNIKEFKAKPYLTLDADGTPREFSYIPLNHYGNQCSAEEYESFSALIDAYYSKKGTDERIRQKSADIFKLLTNAENRIVKKIAIQTEEIGECEKADEYRQMADLITANLYSIKSGRDFVQVVNYYDENMPLVNIPIDSKISPQQNAQRYYKRYAKMKKAKIELSKQIGLAREELEYIHTVFDALSKAEGETDLSQIRNELYQSGYASRMKNYSVQKTQAPKPLKFITSGGYTVYCGKNNTQNDYITTKLAEKTDWWFHVKNLPGSHVLMKCKGEEPSEKDFTESAEIAAFYSKGEGNNIEVDYTLAKHVKKPAGSKPGFVIYHVNWSAVVTPNEKRIREMQIK